VARLLGVKRPKNHGYAILGANDLGLAVGGLLAKAGESVMFIDNNPAACKKAEEEGYRVVFGNVIEDRTLRRAQIEDRAACIALTPNEEVNLMWARAVRQRFDMEQIYVASRRDRSTVTQALVEQAEATVLFGRPRDLELWSLRFRRGTAELQSWRRPDSADDGSGFPENLLLPLLIQRKDRVRPYDSRKLPSPKDSVTVAVFSELAGEATEWLETNGYVRDPDTIPA
jgi:hypothetical protein